MNSSHAAWYDDAQQVLSRRPKPGELVFNSVRSALRWYFEQASIRQSPRSMRIRVQQGEGEQNADPDALLVVLLTIHAAFEAFHAQNHAKARAVLFTYRDGLSQEQASRRLQVDQSTVSRWIGDCEVALLPGLRGAGVVK